MLDGVCKVIQGYSMSQSIGSGLINYKVSKYCKKKV